jgi:AraC family transcriptional activator FtrA
MYSHLVVALVYDRLCTFEFGCTVELFALKRPELEVDWYPFALCPIEQGPIRAMGGFTVDAPWRPDLLEQAGTIVIPGWRDPCEAPPPHLLDQLRAAHARGARIVSICSGVFVLAAAGLLDGLRATTHWRYTDLLARRHPAVRLVPDALYVDEGRIITSAGSAAGIDMLLHLVRRDFGARVSNLVAQRLVLPAHREGGQAQYIPRPVARDERGRLARLIDHVRANPGLPHDTDSMAAYCAMSRRTLQRQIQAATGFGPLEWLVRERIAHAKDILSTTSLPLDQVAERCGFGSVATLRHHFRRVAGTTPSAYRAQSGPTP